MPVNTRIIAHDFEYFTPKTIAETLQLLTRYGKDAKIIAGGTDIVPHLKYEKITPDCLINIMKISELGDINKDNGLRIGAAAKLRDIMRICDGDENYTALYEAVSSIGKIQVINMGTLGGNLCTASPAADSAPALLVLKGLVKILSEQGEKLVQLEDFFQGPNKTAMSPDEIMTEIQVPRIGKGSGSAFKKKSRVASDISKISCAVAVEREGETCNACRIAMGAVAAVPIRMFSTEKILAENKIDETIIDEAGKMVSEEIKPITDMRSTEDYRKQVAGVLFMDVFKLAWQRAGENV